MNASHFLAAHCPIVLHIACKYIRKLKSLFPFFSIPPFPGRRPIFMNSEP